MRFTRSIWFNKLLRKVYISLPLPWHVKQRLKQIYLGKPENWTTPERDIFQLDNNQQTVAGSAKQFDPDDRWILVIDFRIPTPDQDSGSARMTAILSLLQGIGFSITFAADSENYLPEYQGALEKQGIDVLQGSCATRHHIAREGGKYHFVLLSRPDVTFQYLPYVRAYALYSFVIYDTVDLHWVRFEREMQISGDRALLETIAHFRRIELFNSRCADLVLAISNEEKDCLLVEQTGAKVAVLPNIHEIYFPKTPLAQRTGLLFIGGFWHKPNEDAVIYFVNEILPRIIEKIPDLVFNVIGSNMPASVKSLRSANVNPVGFVPDVTPYFESCRIFVAPLRFGAGMKGKVGQSMSHGLPIVTTTIGAEGMGLHHEKHLLIADEPNYYADSVVRLYSDEILWHKLSAGALAHVEVNYSHTAAQKRMADIFTRTQNGLDPEEVQNSGSAILPCSTHPSSCSISVGGTVR